MAGTVTVACKFPSGLIAHHAGKKVHLNGANHESAVGGYGLTENIDQEWFEGWKKELTEVPVDPRDEQGRKIPAGEPCAWFRENLIFAVGKVEGARDKAKEHASVKSGFERMDQKTPMKGIEKAEV